MDRLDELALLVAVIDTGSLAAAQVGWARG
jgi:hypothetical protein